MDACLRLTVFVLAVAATYEVVLSPMHNYPDHFELRCHCCTATWRREQNNTVVTIVPNASATGTPFCERGPVLFDVLRPRSNG